MLSWLRGTAERLLKLLQNRIWPLIRPTIYSAKCDILMKRWMSWEWRTLKYFTRVFWSAYTHTCVCSGEYDIHATVKNEYFSISSTVSPFLGENTAIHTSQLTILHTSTCMSTSLYSFVRHYETFQRCSIKMQLNTFIQVLYLNRILKYLYFTWVFPCYATLYFFSITFQREILYFSFHTITLVTLQIKGSAHRLRCFKLLWLIRPLLRCKLRVSYAGSNVMSLKSMY